MSGRTATVTSRGSADASPRHHRRRRRRPGDHVDARNANRSASGLVPVNDSERNIRTRMRKVRINLFFSQ